MKKALVLMALVMGSFSVQANELSPSSEATLFPFAMTIMSTISTRMTLSDYNYCKEAQQIMADANEYTVTGELAPYLKQSVEIVQAQSEGLSTAEAVDLLIEKAVSILE
jgi:hypothetical protein